MTKNAVRLDVITDSGGRVLATKPVTRAEASLGMPGYSRLVAGPAQELHDIEVELPETLLRSWDPGELLEIVQARIDETRRSGS